MDTRDIRRQVSAHKARRYFAEAGRGLLMSQIEKEPVPPFLQWMHERIPEVETKYYRNVYVPMSDMPDAPEDLRHALGSYSPGSQAVVVIEYEKGAALDWELVEIREDFNAEDVEH